MVWAPSITVKKLSCQDLCPRIHVLIETAQSTVLWSKKRKERVFFAAPAAKFWRCDISSASDKAFPGFLGDLNGCSSLSKNRCLMMMIAFTTFNSSLATLIEGPVLFKSMGIWVSYSRILLLFVNGVTASRSNHVLWRFLSSKVIWVLCHCLVDVPHLHTFEGDSALSKFVVCSPPSESRRVTTRITSASLKRFRLKIPRRPVRFFAFTHRGACAPGNLRIYFDSSRKIWTAFGSGWLMWEV